jgi:hypothetical protein
MESLKARIENCIFLLFYKMESNPAEAGKILAHALGEAMFDIYPRSRFENGIKRNRSKWYQSFYDSLLLNLQTVQEGIDYHKKVRSSRMTERKGK